MGTKLISPSLLSTDFENLESTKKTEKWKQQNLI
ncbi:pentose-5-phosphate-3-epimerase [Chryseobacterium sp. 16F]|uniref:Pentose-5-phosphate-3-epimerase n=1 Tax=Frigoriflavimonas asaccharolytica TaxID=2735899 RepID=A0A8J8GC79_9FLAO|nr:pentose-5-phosphate-3-epimerase [Frigoriflavimonas asaccharolytica]